MPRIARRVADGCVYHVLNRGNGRQRIFHKDGDYLAFIGLIGQLQERFAVEMLAYCLMPNHFHLLLKPLEGAALSRGLQWCLTTHVRRYHQHYGGSGHIWQGRYKSFPVESDQLLTVVRYVEGNPVRAGLVDTAAGWGWSSHRERCGLEQNGMLSPLPIALPGGWTTFVDAPLSVRELEKVRNGIPSQKEASR